MSFRNEKDVSLEAHVEGASTVEPLKTEELAWQAALEEHQLTLAGALCKYPKVVLWSILLSTSIIMEGYDIVLMGSFFAQPAFS